MPNAIKYKTGNLTGSLEKGTIALGTNVLGPTSNTGWYSGVTPDTNRYIVYKTSLTDTPRIFSPINDSELIRLAQQEGATGANTGSASSVLSWMASQTNLLAVNKAYPNIITDNLVYLIDSTFISSYPTTGTTTYPLDDIANVGNGTLQNGVGFNSDALSFIFDGSDDQIPLAISDNFQNIDFSTGFTLMVLYKIDTVTDLNGQFRCMFGVTGGGRTWNYYLYGASNPATTLQYHFSGQMSSGLSNSLTVTSDTYHLGAFTIVPGTTVGTYYHDGTVVSTQTAASSPSYTTAGGTQYIGRGDNMWKGNIAKVMIYNKALTQAEILQTYYQGNIATDGLVFALDAGNLISYIGRGTTTYSLTGSNSSTLTNGITYSSGYGGNWGFDGVDDYMNFTAPNLGTTTTVEMWCKIGSGYDGKMFFGWLYYDVWCGGANLGYNTAVGDVYGISSDDVSSLGLVDNWKHYVFEMRSDVSYTNNKIYINGVSQTLSQQLGGENSGAINFNSGNGRIAGWLVDTNYPMPMNCSIFKVYNRALTQQEINQNFIAYSSRFGI